jgi:hypothetical protein
MANLDKTESSPEFDRQYKPENCAGCGLKDTNVCEDPSLAREGSALWKWEQEYGRLITTAKMIHIDGRSTIIYQKTPCPIPVKKSGPASCCSFRYKVTR